MDAKTEMENGLKRLNKDQKYSMKPALEYFNSVGVREWSMLEELADTNEGNEIPNGCFFIKVVLMDEMDYRFDIDYEGWLSSFKVRDKRVKFNKVKNNISRTQKIHVNRKIN